MNCRTARRLLDEEAQDVALAAHLKSCAACRAEAAFAGRLAVAVATMPREPAPAVLIARVMEQLDEHPAPRSVPWLPQLSLRPWELSAIGFVTVVLLALLPTALGAWLFPQGAGVAWGSFLAWATMAWGGAQSTVGATWTDAARSLDSSWRSLGSGAPAGGAWAAWLLGTAAFALALYGLLSWRAPEGPEDAHA